jgi:hypothetical protein
LHYGLLCGVGAGEEAGLAAYEEPAEGEEYWSGVSMERFLGRLKMRKARKVGKRGGLR